MSGMKILVIDDEPQMRRALRASLHLYGHEVIDASSGDEGLRKMAAEPCDFVLLDLNLPGLDGLATCRTIRASYEVPIIVLSVRNSESDKVTALKGGADDYLCKPFSVPELLARVEAVGRRKSAGDRPPSVLLLDGVSIDLGTHEVTSNGRKEHLTPKEFDLLRYFVEHANCVIPHQRLLQAVWGREYGGEVEYLRVFINQLRKKIESDPRKPRLILTEPWVGYRFVLPSKS